ncbi:MAG: TRAP transporter large permease, partial [Oscillospiraceae bacterium]|nr:TRAP transporter large permease [Oscillospiraceae bacterium]
AIMNQGGLSKRIIQFCSSLFSWLRGGVGIVCVAANMIFGAVSGSGTAAVAAIGSITAPDMEKIGYKKEFTGGMIAGAASTAPIIPPGNVMIMFAAITGLSITRMFLAGYTPGVTIGVILMVICHFYAKKHNIDYGGKFEPKKVARALYDCFWALLMPLIIIVGITAGFCTPTEAGAIACVYGLIVGIFFYRELNFKKITKVLFSAAEGTGQILSLYAASTMFAYIFTVEGFGKVFQQWLMNVSSGNSIVIMLLVGGFVLLIGCFMEPVAVMPVVLPLVYPLLQSLGCDMVQFGLVFTLCTIIGGLTPPVGSYLFVTVTVVKVGVTKLIPWMMVMILVDLIVVALTVFIPGYCTWLPNALLGAM